jgi:acetyl-CoA carboxylase biotin carboxylase subunit
MHRALRELTIEGIETSRDFHLRMMEDAEFRRGDISIQWLEQRLPSILAAQPSEEEQLVAGIAAALVAERDRSKRGTPNDASSQHPGEKSETAHASWRRAARLDGLRGT